MAVLVTCIGFWVVVSSSGKPWWGGTAYGPRFLADLLPLLVLLALPAVAWIAAKPLRSFAPTAVGLLVAWSVLVNAEGAVSAPAACWIGDGLANRPGHVWDWSDPQFAAGVKVLVHTGSVRRAVRDCNYRTEPYLGGRPVP